MFKSSKIAARSPVRVIQILTSTSGPTYALPNEVAKEEISRGVLDWSSSFDACVATIWHLNFMSGCCWPIFSGDHLISDLMRPLFQGGVFAKIILQTPPPRGSRCKC